MHVKGFPLITAIGCLGICPHVLYAQADNEIQVYASPCIGLKKTIIELHSNYTFHGSERTADPSLARWTNETLEITHGLGENVEIGFYTFTAFSPGGQYEYLGNQIRPRVSVPGDWRWPVGVSLSAEFGVFRPDVNSDFIWQGEIRPIVDKTWGNWYASFNPNLGFVVSGNEPGVAIEPQFKTVYTIRSVFGFGIEYYSNLGTFTGIPAINDQEHLLGPMIDLYVHPDWEINTGFLFGLTGNSNQEIVKVLLGRRFGK